MANKTSLVLILIALFASVKASDICPALLQADCQANNSCEWVTTPEQQCQQAVQCSTMPQVNCQDPSNQSACNWNQGSIETCTVNPAQCVLNGNVCSDEINCDTIPQTDATCSNKGTGGFGCGNYAETQCKENLAYCLWASSYCQIDPLDQTCAELGDQCSENINCSQQAESCTKDDIGLCLQITDSTECIASGCIFQDNYCKEPSSCAAPVLGQCSKVCKAAVSRCVTKPDTCTSIKNDAECKGNNICKWNDKAICSDRLDFCHNSASCDANFCILTPVKPITCVPKTTTQCNSKPQAECTGICQFNQAVAPYCSNINGNCNIFGLENQCKVQGGCSWQSISKCQSKSYSFLLSSAIAMMSIILLF